ncbi:MAG: hypothetical protein ACTHNU_15425 [Gaiellales bacterium]
MLFEQRLRDGIHDGTITVAFRRWRRPQVAAGGRYRTGLDRIEMLAVDVVAPGAITGADARRAGFRTPEEVRASLRGDSALPLYRLRFQRCDEPDPRAVLAATDGLGEADLKTIDRRLDRMDRAAPTPWTRATLRAIAENPGLRAVDLAAGLGTDKPTLKPNVRKLKNLGLTISLPRGYRLSPRGAAYLRSRT